jgi:hypothetical protein
MIKGVADLYIHVQAHISPRFARPPRATCEFLRSMLRDLTLDLLDVDFST